MPAHRTRLSKTRSVTRCAPFLVAGIRCRSLPCSANRAGTPSAAATSSPRMPQGSYVALGDSFTAGPDIPTAGRDAGFEQSSSSYPYLVAKACGCT